MKRLNAIAIGALMVLPAVAQTPFEKNFNDSTLRVDYIMGRGDNGITMFVDGQAKTAGWAGRRAKLNQTPLKGNGSILVSDPATGDTLYIQTFSTLFQEWLTTPEAQMHPESFESSFLVPLPKKDANVTLTLFDNRHEPISKLTHKYRTSDELVKKPAVPPNEARYVHRGGDPKDVIDVAIIAEGFTPEESESFFESARKMAEAILGYEPFDTRKDKFNFVAVMTPSRESGVSVPLEGKWVDTAFGSHYSTFYSPRYLTAPKVKAMHEALTGVPYEHLIVMANTDRYGGGGIYNSYTMAAAHNKMAPIVTVHEFGHSFGGLADEYFYAGEEHPFYPFDIEPWEPNITTNVDFESKWKHLVTPGTPLPTPWTDEGGNREQRMKQADKAAKEAKKGKKKAEKPVVGLYEGAGYSAKGVYRPVLSCRMRDNNNPGFCPVCQEALAKLIDFYTVQ